MNVKDEKFRIPQVWAKKIERYFTDRIQTHDFSDTGLNH